MEKTWKIFEQVVPVIESWLRETVSDEVNKALQADREKRQYVKRYTRAETAEKLGISSVTLWEWCKCGKINPVKVGKRQYFTEEEISWVLHK